MIFPFVLKSMNYSNVFDRVKQSLFFWAGGTISYIVYGIVVWSFTKAPIPLVGALRESGIIFSILIGVFFLKERMTFFKVGSILKDSDIVRFKDIYGRIN